MGTTVMFSFCVSFSLLVLGTLVMSQDDCCEHKMVGEVGYMLVDSKDTKPFGCKDNCVYSTKEGGKFCFKPGKLPSKCMDDTMKENFTEIWTSTGEVPNKLPKAPPAPAWLTYNGKMVEINSTFLTEDMLEWPEVKWKAEEGELYTIIIIDFGIERLNGLQFFHWMITNVPDGKSLKQGDEIMEYIAPFYFLLNENGTGLVDTGKKPGHDILALVYKQTGKVNMTSEIIAGCNPTVGTKIADHAVFAEKYNLELVAGTFFFTLYSPATNDILCFMTKCSERPWPAPLPGINDGADCKK